MKKKCHLTREQRCQISALLQAGHSQKDIAEVIGKDKSVVSRELKRNGGKRGYSARLAQEKAQERKERYGRPRKFTVAMREEVERWLRQEQYSPEQIVSKEGRGAIVTLVERTTGFLLMEKLPRGKEAEGLGCGH